MAWTTPLTAVANATLTAAQWNASVRDNLNETAVAKASAAGQYFVATAANTLAARSVGIDSIAATESTTSTSFADLTSGTAGPTVSNLATGVSMLISLTTSITNNTAGVNTRAGFTVSGATTLAGNHDLAASFEPDSSGQDWHGSICFAYTGLTAGSNTFKMVYKVDSASTGTFLRRRLSIIPF